MAVVPIENGDEKENENKTAPDVGLAVVLQHVLRDILRNKIIPCWQHIRDCRICLAFKIRLSNVDVIIALPF
jgi:hypothetical protein